MSIHNQPCYGDGPERTARTYDEIIAIEPGVAELEHRALHFRRRNPGDDDEEYRYLKGLLCQLVGSEARDSRLRTCECYDIALPRIARALFTTPRSNRGRQSRAQRPRK